MTKEELKTLKINFGENLRKIRESKKLSLMDLSTNCELDASNISKMENGKKNITISTIIELAKGLEVAPKRLLDFEIREIG